MTDTPRLSTGIDGLDELLGGGLLPGTLTAVVGSTGIGKTQFGLQFAQAGLRQENARGVLFDMCSRGDSQSHAEYTRRMFGWELQAVAAERPVDLDNLFSPALPLGDYLHVFDQRRSRIALGPVETYRRVAGGAAGLAVVAAMGFSPKCFAKISRSFASLTGFMT